MIDCTSLPCCSDACGREWRGAELHVRKVKHRRGRRGRRGRQSTAWPACLRRRRASSIKNAVRNFKMSLLQAERSKPRWSNCPTRSRRTGQPSLSKPTQPKPRNSSRTYAGYDGLEHGRHEHGRDLQRIHDTCAHVHLWRLVVLQDAVGTHSISPFKMITEHLLGARDVILVALDYWQ